MKQIIERKIQNSNELMKQKSVDLSIFNHIQAYMHSLCYLEIKDELIEEKISLWNRFFDSEEEEKPIYYKKIIKFMNEERLLIMRALDSIEERKSKTETAIGSVFRKNVWAISTFEHEALDE